MRRRVAILGLLLALDVWVIQRARTTPVLGAPNTVAAQNSCCPPGQSDPHDACVDGQCVSTTGCDFSDCTSCEGCDPDGSLESACLQQEGQWDPTACTCTAPSCDPAQELDCIKSGGQWDNVECVCTAPPCNPGPEVWTGTSQVTVTYCTDCDIADQCVTQTSYYADYCSDGTINNTWSVDVTYCNTVIDYGCEDSCLID